MPLRSISRREFFATSVVSAATAAGFPHLQLASSEPAVVPAEGGLDAEIRWRARWNQDWRFQRQLSPGRGTEPEFVGAQQLDYDDSAWSQLWLPHTWDATPDNPFAPSGHFHGVGWY